MAVCRLSVNGRVASKTSEGWSSFRDNVVVDSGGAALAAGLAALDGKTNAIYHALGVGRFQWDVDLPNPSKDDTGLVSEFFRKTPDTITFMAEHEGLHEVTGPNPDDELESAQFADISDLLPGRIIEIVAGTAAGDVREIVSYASPNVVTLDAALSATPDATTRWRVGVVNATPTNVVDVETTFLATEDNSDGQIREQGLFLGSATAELDSGTMMSYIRHNVQAKTGSDLTSLWRIKIEVV